MDHGKAVSSVTTAAVLVITRGTVQRRDRTDGAKNKGHVDIVERGTTIRGNVGHRESAIIAKKRDIWREIARKGNNRLRVRHRR